VISIYFIRTGFENGYLKASKLKAGKIFVAILMLIQFNFILYMIPATDFWAFAFFFCSSCCVLFGLEAGFLLSLSR